MAIRRGVQKEGDSSDHRAEAMPRARRLLSEVLPVPVDEHFPTRAQVAGE